MFRELRNTHVFNRRVQNNSKFTAKLQNNISCTNRGPLEFPYWNRTQVSKVVGQYYCLVRFRFETLNFQYFRSETSALITFLYSPLIVYRIAKRNVTIDFTVGKRRRGVSFMGNRCWQNAGDGLPFNNNYYCILRNSITRGKGVLGIGPRITRKRKLPWWTRDIGRLYLSRNWEIIRRV